MIDARKRYRLPCCFALAWCLATLNAQAVNHPFHISTAEVEYNPTTKRLEVGLKCQSMDLERALGRLAGKKIDIEKDAAVDELVTRYLTDRFYLAVAPTSSKDKSESTDITQEVPEPLKEPIKLVGKEFETTWVWIYFESPVPAGDEPFVLVNRVLFEVNTGQINTSLIRYEGKRDALKSTTFKPFQSFKREWLKAASKSEK